LLLFYQLKKHIYFDFQNKTHSSGNCLLNYGSKKYSEINLGCGINVSHGISWVFEKEEMAIILEDDCLPSISFFNYAKELLIKYKDDNRIMHIGGTNWHPEYKHEDDSSYFFSKDAHIWGWATWKRAWKNFDYEMKDYPLFINSKEFKTIISNRDERKYFRLRWDSFFKSNYKSNSKSNWDYQWYYAVLKNKGLCIWPKSNLVMNIGVNGTHTDKVYSKYHFVKTDNEFIIKDPNALDVMWIEDMKKLFHGRLQLSNEDEETIRKIANKL
jgi:hypothetical protein